MQRRKFLTDATVASTVVATVIGTTTRSLASHPQPALPKKAFTVKAGESRFGERTPFRGVNPNDLKVSGKDTNGTLAMFEYIGKEKTGPTLHVHLDQDEIFYVVEGEYRFQVGTDQFTAKAGDTVFGPRNVPHTWLQLSDAGKLVYLVQPAGTMEAFFTTMSQLSGPPTEEALQAIHRQHGMTVLGPPLKIG